MLYDEIKKNFEIPNAFENWREYRESLTKYMIQRVKEQEKIESREEKLRQEDEDKGQEQGKIRRGEKNKGRERGKIRQEKSPTLMILGAGSCNDLDLSLLVKHFSSIVLMDYDENSMRQAMQRYALSDFEREKIIIRGESLNGIGEEEYISFCEELRDFIRQRGREITKEEFERYALNLFEHFLRESERSGKYLGCFGEERYDYICCFGLHSQLQAMFSYIYRAFEKNLRQIIGHISSPNFTARLVEEDERFIPEFHDILFQYAKKKVFIGCEYERCQEIEIPAMKRREIGVEEIEPIEGAYQGIRDIRGRKLNKIEYTITWPFAPQYGICYNMLVEEITV